MKELEEPRITARLFEIAEFATQDQDKKLVLAGIYNTMRLQRNPDAPPGASEAVPFTGTLVWVVECSIALGTRHRARLRIQTEDGQRVLEDIELGDIVFFMNPQGRAMRHQGIVKIPGLILPRATDYDFLLFFEPHSEPVATASLYLEVVAPEA